MYIQNKNYSKLFFSVNSHILIICLKIITYTFVNSIDRTDFLDRRTDFLDRGLIFWIDRGLIFWIDSSEYYAAPKLEGSGTLLKYPVPRNKIINLKTKSMRQGSESLSPARELDMSPRCLKKQRVSIADLRGKKEVKTDQIRSNAQIFFALLCTMIRKAKHSPFRITFKCTFRITF